MGYLEERFASVGVINERRRDREEFPMSATQYPHPTLELNGILKELHGVVASGLVTEEHVRSAIDAIATSGTASQAEVEGYPEPYVIHFTNPLEEFHHTMNQRHRVAGIISHLQERALHGGQNA